MVRFLAKLRYSGLYDHLPFSGTFRHSSSKKFSKITWFCACGVSTGMSAAMCLHRGEVIGSGSDDTEVPPKFALKALDLIQRLGRKRQFVTVAIVTEPNELRT